MFSRRVELLRSTIRSAGREVRPKFRMYREDRIPFLVHSRFTTCIIKSNVQPSTLHHQAPHCRTADGTRGERATRLRQIHSFNLSREPRHKPLPSTSYLLIYGKNTLPLHWQRQRIPLYFNKIPAASPLTRGNLSSISAFR